MRTLFGVCVALLVACGDKGGGNTDGGGTGDGNPRDATPLPDSAPPDISIYEAYAQAWGEADATARQGLLDFSVVDTLTVYEPTRTLASRTEVEAAMVQFLADYPGGTIPIIGNVRETKQRAWFNWDVKNGNNTSVQLGFDVMKVAADARIERVHSFFGTLPAAVGANTAVQQALIDAWNEPDNSLRNMKLMMAVTDNVAVVLESAPGVSTGRAALSAVIGNQLNTTPTRLMSVTSGYVQMTSGFAVAWKLADGGTTMGAGVMMALLAGDGRISELVYWDSATP
jgi:hypothetical protein